MSESQHKRPSDLRRGTNCLRGQGRSAGSLDVGRLAGAVVADDHDVDLPAWGDARDAQLMADRHDPLLLWSQQPRCELGFAVHEAGRRVRRAIRRRSVPVGVVNLLENALVHIQNLIKGVVGRRALGCLLLFFADIRALLVLDRFDRICDRGATTLSPRGDSSAHMHAVSLLSRAPLAVSSC